MQNIYVKNIINSPKPVNKKMVEVGKINLKEAGERMGVSSRHAKRIRRAIREIEQKLANSEIIDRINLPDGKVGFGSTVTLENLNNGGKVTYQIVGPDESDISLGKISITSPLGKALIGKETEDEVTAHTPGGAKSYTILKI